MSFPTSVFSKSNVSNGQVSDPADVNDVYAELTAITGGLINGTAPVNSSRVTATAVQVSGGSTLASVNVTGASTLAGATTISGNSTLAGGVSVTGNSTVAGSLNVTGNSTFTGTVNFTGTVTGISIGMPTVKVNSTGVTQVAFNTWTGLNWDTEAFDASGMHSTSANSSRLTFAHSTGIYAVGATVEWSTNSNAGVRGLQILFNDATATPVISAIISADAGGNQPEGQSVFSLVSVASTTDYVTARVLHNCPTSTSRLNAASTSLTPQFWAYKVSS